MQDWKAIAKALGLGGDAGDLERIAGPIEALEETFRPLLKDLTPDLEPSVEFRAEEDQ